MNEFRKFSQFERKQLTQRKVYQKKIQKIDEIILEIDAGNTK